MVGKKFVKMRYEKWVAENSAVLLRQKVSVSWLEKGVMKTRYEKSVAENSAAILRQKVSKSWMKGRYRKAAIRNQSSKIQQSYCDKKYPSLG